MEKEWMKKSWLFQQQMFQMLSDRDWDDVSNDIFEEKMVFAFKICYGENYNKNEKFDKITKNVRAKIYKLFDKSTSKKIMFTFISLLIDNKKESTFLVIWIKTDKNEYCVDLNCREYQNWEDFIENNLLPQCKIMYPVNGRYHSLTNGFISYYIDIILEESVACSCGKIAKKVLDVTSSLGFAAATTVLLLNPISAPVTVGAVGCVVATGVYNIGSSAAELVDVHKHEGGINIRDSKSLIPIGEIAVTAAGAVAVSAGAIARSVAAEANFMNKLFAGNSFVFKLADSANTINKIACVSNLAFNITVVVHKYLSGNLSINDIKYIGNILIFGFNLFLSYNLLEKVIAIFSSMVDSGSEIILLLLSHKLYSSIKSVLKFTTETDLEKVLEYLFPRKSIYINNVAESINNISKNIDSIILKTQLFLKENKMGCMLDISYLLFSLLKKVTTYMDEYKKEITNKYDKFTCTVVENWLRYDGIDCCGNISEFDNITNIPNVLEEKVKDTVKECFRQQINSFKNINVKEKLLFSTLMKMIKLNKFIDSKYIINKLNYYCKCFRDIYSLLVEVHFYEYFLYKTDKDSIKDKDTFFKTEMYVTENILEFLFHRALHILEKNEKFYCAEFETKYSHKTICDETNKNYVHKFTIPNKSKLSKKDYYDKAKGLIPTLYELIDDQYTTFEQYFGGTLVVIRSKFKNDFTLYFYTIRENNDLNGILVRV